MLELVGFHAWFTAGTLQLDAAFDAAAQQVGMALLSADKDPWSRVYGGGAAVDCHVDLSSPRAQLLVGPLERKTIEFWGGDIIASFLTTLCRGIGVTLGRTYRDGPGLVQPEELSGQVDFIDWFQYLSAPIAAKWDLAHLKAGPFSRVDVFGDGAVALVLGSDPFEGIMSRRRAADYLGIELAPRLVKGPTGETISLDWK